MRRYETEAAKQNAIDTLRLLMSSASTDGAFRGYARQLDEVLARPVAPDICAFGACKEPIEDLRSYCRAHSSVSWIAAPPATKE